MKCFKQSGFTLIEIVVTVVIVAIFSTMMLTFISKSLVDSTDPVKRLKQSSDLHKAIANITADYNRYPKWRTGTSYAAGNFIVPTIRNGHFYVCTSPGLSGATEPANWPAVSAATVNDGGLIWTESGTLPSLTTLQGSIGPQNSYQNSYSGDGKYYYIDKNRFVLFNSSGSEVDDTTGLNKILKVTIRNDQGGTLTALFFSN